MHGMPHDQLKSFISRDPDTHVLHPYLVQLKYQPVESKERPGLQQHEGRLGRRTMDGGWKRSEEGGGEMVEGEE